MAKSSSTRSTRTNSIICCVRCLRIPKASTERIITGQALAIDKKLPPKDEGVFTVNITEDASPKNPQILESCTILMSKFMVYLHKYC